MRAACRGRRSRRGNANAPDGSARRWRAVVVLWFIFMGCQPRGVVVPEGDLLRDLYFRGSPAVSTVALTFDDGPNGRCTEAVLDALAALHAPATFFVLGKNVATAGNEGLLGRMVREGHVIGVHGYWHGVRRLFWQDVTEDDIRAAFAVCSSRNPNGGRACTSSSGACRCTTGDPSSAGPTSRNSCSSRRVPAT